MEQVYLSYGKRSNQELLLLYGARTPAAPRAASPAGARARARANGLALTPHARAPRARAPRCA